MTVRTVRASRRLAAGVFTALGLAAPVDAASFTLSARGLTEGAALPLAQVHSRYGCTGSNLPPPLAWTPPPPGTKSLAVTLFDADAPTGRGWWHWVLFDLPPDLRGVPPALPPEAREARNDFDEAGYGGACPPQGDRPHRYAFTVWALDTAHLPFDAGAPDARVGAFLRDHAIGQATLTLRYGR